MATIRGGMLMSNDFIAQVAKLALATALATGIAHPALAQTNGASDDQFTDIIVTAQRRSERAIDVPATLSFLPAESLNRGGAPSTLDLTYQTPGLKMDRVGVNTVPAIRGVSSLVTTPGLDVNVATYVDGVYSSAGAAILDLPDVDNIVILKGPQGTLFGRNATGGAVQIATKKPEFDFGGSASVGYGRFNDLTAKAFVTGPLIPGLAAISLSGAHQDNDGYLRNVVNNRRFGKLESNMIRGKLLVTPASNLELVFSAYYSKRKDPTLQSPTIVNNITQANALAGSIYGQRPYEVAFNDPPVVNSKLWGVSFSGKLDTSAGEISLITAYDNQYVFAKNPGLGAFTPGGPQLYFFANQKEKKSSIELNFASAQFGAVNFVTGLYYYHNIGAFDPLQFVRIRPGVPDVYVASIFGYQKTESMAAYGEVNFKATDRFTITAGLRYSVEDKGITGQFCTGCNRLDPVGALTNFGKADFDAWTPRLSLRYEVADRSNIYFTYSKGFKSGGFNTSSTFGTAPPLTPVKPETLDAFEVGLKSASSRMFNFGVSAFYYKYKDQQVNAFVGNPPLAVINNAAKSNIYGAEFEGTAHLSSEIDVNVGASYTHAKFGRYDSAQFLIPGPAAVNGQPNGNSTVLRSAKGFDLPRTPEWTFLLGAKYEKEFDAGTLLLKADLYHSSKFYFDVANLYKQSAYENLDASIAWTFPGDMFTVSVWGKNLTDEAKPLGTFIAGPSSAYYWLPPITYGITGSIKF